MTEPAFQQFMDNYLRTYKGMKPGNSDKLERAKVNAGYRRFGRAAKDILAMAKGDSQKAWQGTQAIGAHLSNNGFSTWGLDAIARLFCDWEMNPRRFTKAVASMQRQAPRFCDGTDPDRPGWSCSNNVQIEGELCPECRK